MTSPAVEEALKACPLCAGHAILEDVANFLGDPRWAVVCETENCIAGVERETRAEVIIAWNTRPLPIEAQGGETEKRKALATAIAKAMYGNDRPSEADYRAADAALAITHPDSSLESREARKPLKPWNTGDSAGLILALEHHMDQQDEAWPRGSASRSPLASVLDEAAEHIRALSSPPSLGMEGVRELQALSDAAMVGPWHSEPGAWISGPEHKGLIADCHPTFGGATDEHKATSKFIVATVNYVRQALASISTPSGEVG